MNEIISNEIVQLYIPVKKTYGEGVYGLYRDFEIYDPNGHLIQVSSYPDLILPKFRGY